MKPGNIQGDPFRSFVEAIVAGDDVTAIRLLDASPLLAQARAVHGATRQSSKQNFFEKIQHYMYEGDTALHMAAAAHQSCIAEELIARSADVHARNRRGAEPLHYAVDGGPGLSAWDQNAQAKIIGMLLRAGADPNAVDKSEASPAGHRGPLEGISAIPADGSSFRSTYAFSESPRFLTDSAHRIGRIYS